jgi:hypothetical protein
MRYRACFSFLLLVSAAACATATESPTAPPSLAVSPSGDDGEPPPPPLDTGDVDINMNYDGGSFSPAGRYFANKQRTNAWIAFETSYHAGAPGIPKVVASPDARLQYNERSGKSSGRGTLELYDVEGSLIGTIVLGQLSVAGGTLGSCSSETGVCGSLFFKGDGSVRSLGVYLEGRMPPRSVDLPTGR